MFVYRERTKSDLDLRNLLKIELPHAWFAYLDKFSPNLFVSIFSVLNHSCPLWFIIICPWCFSILIIFRFPSIQNTVSDLPYHYNSKVRCLVDGVLEKKKWNCFLEYQFSFRSHWNRSPKNVAKTINFPDSCLSCTSRDDRRICLLGGTITEHHCWPRRWAGDIYEHTRQKVIYLGVSMTRSNVS